MSVTNMGLFGRSVIYTDTKNINRKNVVEILNNSLLKHSKNSSDIDYLYNYYKGNQPIIYKENKTRPEINNIVVENRANEIVSFKVGYLMGEPMQYVSRSNDDKISFISDLNDYVFNEDKSTKDIDLATWFTICGIAYRMVLPSEDKNDLDSPFKIYTLDPRYSFIVRYSGLGNMPVMGVKYVKQSSGKIVYSVYTETDYFEIVDGRIIKNEKTSLGRIPIIEYVLDGSRMGAFEMCLPLLDAINEVSSNRIDGVEQFIQSLMMFKGVDVDDEDFDKLKEMGAIKVPTDGDIKYLTSELNQTQTQTLVDYMYQTVLTICGMPNRNGGNSTSDTGTAVIYRDGYYLAEGRAKNTETYIKMSEKEFLKIAISIMNDYKSTDLKVSDIDIRFTRRNYENITEKANVLTQMLNNDYIAKKFAFEYCGMFADPVLVYEQSMNEYKENQKKNMEELEKFRNISADLEKEKINNIDGADVEKENIE